MPPFYVRMLLLYAVTLFVSATLLFLIQPMVGKMILPLLGGTPAVWNTCMVFFQAILLLGYTYAHLTTTLLGARFQAMLHLLLLIVPAFVLPIVVNRDLAPQGQNNPVFGVFLLLFVTAALPFFVVATSAPLLQKWFASTGHPAAKDPYFLYGASNLGSMLALYAYPLLLEPYKALPGQSKIWEISYYVLGMLTAACAAFLWLSPRRSPDYAAKTSPVNQGLRTKIFGQHATDDAPSLARRLRWIALAFVPSSLMLGVTTFITTDVAAVPFIWVVPLSIYLLSFILVFSRMPSFIHWIMVGLFPLAVLTLVFTVLSDLRWSFSLEILLYLATLFVVSMVCHGELARDRPSTDYLTGFYLLMSLGGVLGGIFNTLVAPLVFVSVQEHYLALVFACFLIPRLGPKERTILGLIVNLGLAWVIGTAGAYLAAMVLRYDQINAAALIRPVATPGTILCLAVLLAFVTAYVLLGKRELLNRVFDIVLPLLLALLMFGLLWGLPVLRTRFSWLDAWLNRDVEYWGVKIIPAAHVLRYVAYGLPALVCLSFFRRPVQFGLGVAAVLLVGELHGAQNTNVIHQERSFYGVLKAEEGDEGKLHWLIHGNINHGVQRRYDWKSLGAELFAPLAACRPADAALSAIIRNQIWTEKHYPVAYFHRDTPYGQMFLSFQGKYAKKNVAIIGLGTGGLSGYAYPGQKWTYFELDPAVERIARNEKYFTYLTDCQKRGIDLKVILGDARVQLEKIDIDKPENKFDVIAFDAFTSDAIPVHLITYDALKLYLSKLTEDGIVVFHISNRYVDLRPVIVRLQQEAHLAGLIQNDEYKGDNVDHYGTLVIILARRMEAFGPLAYDKRWQELDKDWLAQNKFPNFPLWTDDYSNLLGVFKWKD